MKKLISLVLALCMACMLIPALADDINVTGEWYLKIMKMGDQEMDAAALGFTATLSLSENGTAVFGMIGEPQTGTWTLDGDTITVTIDDSPASGPVTADSLTIEADGQVMVFTREATQAITMADPKPAETAEEFYGEWTCAFVEMDGTIMNLSAMGLVYPNVTLGDGTVEFIAGEDDLFGTIFNMLGLQSSFEDGVLKIVATVEGANATGTAQMLQDGMLKFSLDNEGTTLILYYTRVQAAEEPAA